MRRPGAIVGFAAAWVVAVVGCMAPEEAQDADGVEVHVDSSGRFPVVRNSGRPPQWSLEPIGSVGSTATLDDPAPDEFGRISSVTTGPEETVWVADQLNDQIKVFRGDGSVSLQLGREGQGPGEYSAIYSLAWAGDRLLVLDLGNGRVAELSATGEWLGTRPAPGRISGSPAMLRFYPVSDSSVVQWSLDVVDEQATRVWVQHGPEGVGQTWPQVTLDPPEPTSMACNRPDGAVSFFSMPFGGQMLRHPAESGSSYQSWSAAYRFALVAPTGDTLRVVERDWPSVPVTDQDWEQGTAEFEAFQEEWPGADCTPERMERPATKVPLRNLLMDTEGRVWVEAVGQTGSVWEVFDPRGRLIGSLPGFEYDSRVAPSIRGNRLAWAATDSLGVQYVHWGRIIVSEDESTVDIAPR